MAKKKDKLVPYDQVSPGFEAVYTGETSSTPVQENEMNCSLHSDEKGNLIRQWSTIPWTFPDKEDGWKKDQWGAPWARGTMPNDRAGSDPARCLSERAMTHLRASVHDVK